MLASAKPQISDATERYAQTTTTALASVGRIRLRTSNRSAAVPTQREAGQTTAAINAAQRHKTIAAAAELIARRRVRVTALVCVPSMRSVRYRSASRQNA